MIAAVNGSSAAAAQPPLAGTHSVFWTGNLGQIARTQTHIHPQKTHTQTHTQYVKVSENLTHTHAEAQRIYVNPFFV